MEAAIELEILRNERQHVGIFRGLGNTPEAFVEIVVVVKENTASAVGQDGEQIVLSGRGRKFDQALASGWLRIVY